MLRPAGGGAVAQLLGEQDGSVYTGAVADEPKRFTRVLEGTLWPLRELRAGPDSHWPAKGATSSPPSDAKRGVSPEVGHPRRREAPGRR